MRLTTVIARQSPDWAALDDESFALQLRSFAREIGFDPSPVEDAVNYWNRTLKRSYFSVRQELKELARQNWQAAPALRVVTSSAAQLPQDLADGYCLFVDDDDWIAPDITARLDESYARRPWDACVWGSAAFGSFAQQVFRLRAVDGFCFTNNYALSSEHLRAHPEHLPKAYQHMAANRLLKSVSTAIENGYWAVTNKAPTSATYLQRLMKTPAGASGLADALKAYVRRSESLLEHDMSATPWAWPLAQRTLAIFRDLVAD